MLFNLLTTYIWLYFFSIWSLIFLPYFSLTNWIICHIVRGVNHIFFRASPIQAYKDVSLRKKKVLIHMCGEQIQGYHLCQESCDISRLLQCKKANHVATFSSSTLFSQTHALSLQRVLHHLLLQKCQMRLWCFCRGNTNGD
jgi:hypothetical protein